MASLFSTRQRIPEHGFHVLNSISFHVIKTTIVEVRKTLVKIQAFRILLLSMTYKLSSPVLMSSVLVYYCKELLVKDSHLHGQFANYGSSFFFLCSGYTLNLFLVYFYVNHIPWPFNGVFEESLAMCMIHVGFTLIYILFPNYIVQDATNLMHSLA